VKPNRVAPSRDVLQKVADRLTFETRYEGGPDAEFVVSEDGIQLEFHLRRGAETATIAAPVWMVDRQMYIQQPRGWVATFNLDDFLDKSLPHWNN